jgi:hypothetical protein
MRQYFGMASQSHQIAILRARETLCEQFEDCCDEAWRRFKDVLASACPAHYLKDIIRG